LSYHVATVIPIGLIEKQRLLEMPSVGDRLEAEREILCRETQRVQEFASLSREKGYFYYRGKRLSLN